MRNLLGQSDRCVATLDRLIWITEEPQEPGHTREAGYANVLTVEYSLSAMLLRFIESKNLLPVFPGVDELTEAEQRYTDLKMRSQKKRRILLALGEAQTLLRQVPGRFVVCAYGIKCRQPAQDGEELSGLAYLLTQFSGASVGFLPLPGPHNL